MSSPISKTHQASIAEAFPTMPAIVAVFPKRAPWNEPAFQSALFNGVTYPKVMKARRFAVIQTGNSAYLPKIAGLVTGEDKLVATVEYSGGAWTAKVGRTKMLISMEH